MQFILLHQETQLPESVIFEKGKTFRKVSAVNLKWGGAGGCKW